MEFFNWRRFLATKIIFIKIVPVGSIRCSRGRRMDREPCHDIQSHVPASNSRSLDSEVSRSDVCIFSSCRLLHTRGFSTANIHRVLHGTRFLRDRWKTNCLNTHAHIYTCICTCIYASLNVFFFWSRHYLYICICNREISMYIDTNVFQSWVRAAAEFYRFRRVLIAF